jgi:hypothetical protein
MRMRHYKICLLFVEWSIQVNAMYFGLIAVPTYFMDLMNKVFMEYLDKFIVVVIDGILVYSKSEEESEDHFRLA